MGRGNMIQRTYGCLIIDGWLNGPNETKVVVPNLHAKIATSQVNYVHQLRKWLHTA
jgi:hypothetical protein